MEPDPPSAPPRDPSDVLLNSSIPGTLWNILVLPGAGVDLDYVEIDWSQAMTYNIPVQPARLPHTTRSDSLPRLAEHQQHRFQWNPR